MYRCFLLGADVCKEGAPLGVFRYPSYVQDIMGFVLCFFGFNARMQQVIQVH